MKKTFVSATVVISTIVMMVSIGVNFSAAAEKMMNKDMMMKQGDMMTDKGQMMMDEGKKMKEGMMK